MLQGELPDGHWNPNPKIEAAVSPCTFEIWASFLTEMSAATVAEPFLLSSYPDAAPHRKLWSAPVYASLPSTSDADPFVTVAVHGDGIHVLDVRTALSLLRTG